MLFETLKNRLVESSLSSIHKYLDNPDASFGIISAFRGNLSKDENLARHKNLIATVRNNGLGYIQMAGGFVEDGKEVVEYSLFVPKISMELLFDLGNKYDQFSVIYKNKDEFAEYRPNGAVVQRWQGKMSLDPEKIKQYFSRLVKGSHRNKKFVFLSERHDVRWWTEWSTYKNGDDSSLWFRIL